MTSLRLFVSMRVTLGSANSAKSVKWFCHDIMELTKSLIVTFYSEFNEHDYVYLWAYSSFIKTIFKHCALRTSEFRRIN